MNGFASPTRLPHRRVSYRDAADVLQNANSGLQNVQDGRAGMGKLGQLQTAYPDDAWNWESKTPIPGSAADVGTGELDTNLLLGIGAAVLVIAGGVYYLRS